jgi:hypothetical protein
MSRQQDQEPLKIVEFRARNIKRLQAVTIKPDPDSPIVLLTGKNRQGKSSIIDAIWMALGGKGAIPSKPIHEGATEGESYIDLGKFTVTRRLTENGEYLDVRTKDGFKAPRPQEFLSSRLGDRAQNPLEFMRLSPPDQVKALQGMVRINLDLNELGNITGLNTKGIKVDDPIAVMDNAYKHLFDKRTEVNREVKRLEGVVKSIIVPAGKEDVQPVIVAELFEERKQLDQKKKQNDLARDMVASLWNKISLFGRDIQKTDQEIMDLEEKIARLKAARSQMMKDHEEALIQYDAEQAAINQLVDPDYADIDARIAAADETNRIAAMVNSKSQSVSELQIARTNSEDLTIKIKAVAEYKTRLIQEAGLPVPGLGFDAGEVTFNGIPLSQASGREQIEISTAICAAQNPEIGILTIDIGWSELDRTGQEALTNFAREHGLQIWCTKVMEEPGDQGFYIQDGTIIAVDGQPVEPEAPDVPEVATEHEEVASWN